MMVINWVNIPQHPTSGNEKLLSSAFFVILCCLIIKDIMKRPLLLLALGIAAALATPLAVADATSDCILPSPQNVFADHRVYGALSPASVSQVAAKRAGHVAEWHVDVGDAVTKGDPLMSLEATHEAYALDHAIQARRLAERQLASSQQLVTANHVSAIAIEEMKTTLAQRVLEEHQATLAANHRILRAPFNGIVEARLVEVGEHVAEGQQALRLVERDRHLLSADLYQAPSRCADADACLLYYDVGDGMQGPHAIDFMVPLTELKQGMFRVGAYLDGEMTSGVPATLYVVPASQCETP